MEQLVSDYVKVRFGTDPEAFFQNPRGFIIGSELVIPEVLKSKHGEIVRDGVQLEIHVRPEFSREKLAKNIGNAFRTLNNHLYKRNDGSKLNLKAVVRVTQGQLNRLSDKSRELGCAPSENIYDEKAAIGVNPKTYKVRSAGGHVHLELPEKLMGEYKRVIRACDVLVGNQAVLFDREPLQALRRRVYGRAGECRPQKYGVEYRTLSNFWLRSDPLVSFVLGMARNAVRVIATSEGVTRKGEAWNAEKAMFDYINIPNIIKAINKNDFDLAMKNYEGIEKFICKHFHEDTEGLNPMNVANFRRFVENVQHSGIEYYFPDEADKYWAGKPASTSWEEFLEGI